MTISLEKVISELVNEISKTILVNMYDKSTVQYKKALVSLELAFNKYLKSSHNRYSNIKTLLYRDRPVSLRNHYVSSDFQISEEKIAGDGILNKFLSERRNIVTGTAGSGKSVLLRRLFLDLVEAQRGLAPILIELRLVESLNEEITIQKYIHKTISEMDEGVSEEQIHFALKQGKIMLLLDGFDEIDFSKREVYEREIHSISRRYPNSVIVVSSRPDDCFSSWEEFHVFRALPLTNEQAADLISRIDYDSAVKKKFIAALTGGLYGRHKDFLSNPLLLTMMLLTYEQLAEIPEKIHIFYEQAFDTLFHKHDALKSLYKRKSYTGLPIDDFKRLFAVFCILSYFDRKITFTYKDLFGYIDQAIELESVNTDPQKFFNDLIKSVCIIQKDGNVYTFTHRSFQEYFSAYFISRSQSLDFSGLLDTIVQSYFRDSVFEMLFELNREKIEMKWILPKLRKLVPVCEEIVAKGDMVELLSVFYGGLTIHGDQIAFRLADNKHDGYFASLLAHIYREQARQNFNLEKQLPEGVQEKKSEDAALLKKHCNLKPDGSISLSELPNDKSWLGETGVPAYCKRKINFLKSLLTELDDKYTAKGNSLKVLLSKNIANSSI